MHLDPVFHCYSFDNNRRGYRHETDPSIFMLERFTWIHGKSEVKTEDSPERLTVSFKFHKDKMKWKASMLKKAHRDLAAAQRQLSKLQKDVSRGVTWVLVFLLHCLDYLAYVEEFYKTQITTAMQLSRISQYHNVQNGEDTLFKTCRTKYADAVRRNRLLFVKEHSFRYHYLIVLNFMLY